MKAMILAAGRGERMRPLTDQCPKPLLPLAGKPLIEYHLEALAAASVDQVVINQGWLGEQLPEKLGDGRRWGLQIHYSDERPQALETAGGIIKALPLLGDEPFLVVNGDVYCPFDFATIGLRDGQLAQLLMVDNPPHNATGDFFLSSEGLLSPVGEGSKLTFAGIGMYAPQLFADLPVASAPLAPLLRRAMMAGQVGGQRHAECWCDVGTPERLQALQKFLL